MYLRWYGVFIVFLIFFFACQKDPIISFVNHVNLIDTIDSLPPPVYDPTPYNFLKPAWFPPPILPEDNPLTNKGVALGRKMFYDPILSADSTQSCSSCHNQQFAFTDNGKKFSTGVDNIQGNRNSMQIVNFAFNKEQKFFWDGRALGLEEQALGPVENPIEMQRAGWHHNHLRLF